MPETKVIRGKRAVTDSALNVASVESGGVPPPAELPLTRIIMV